MLAEEVGTVMFALGRDLRCVIGTGADGAAAAVLLLVMASFDDSALREARREERSSRVERVSWAVGIM
jgi:hypothetical protein